MTHIPHTCLCLQYDEEYGDCEDMDGVLKREDSTAQQPYTNQGRKPLVRQVLELFGVSSEDKKDDAIQPSPCFEAAVRRAAQKGTLREDGFEIVYVFALFYLHTTNQVSSCLWPKLVIFGSNL